MHLSIILNKLLLFTKGRSSSETQGQIVGASESPNGWEKMARRKVKNGKESAWGQSFTRPVPNCRGRSGFWLVQETFVFFCPIRGQQTLESFLCVLTCKVHKGVSCSPCLSWLFAEALHTEVKRFNVRTLTGLVSSPYDACVAKKSEQRLSNRGRPITFICLVIYFVRNPVPVFIVLLALLQRRFSVFVRHQTRIFCLHWIFGCLYLKVSNSNVHF